MGEIADSMVNGFLCEMCGVYLDGEEPGHPRQCEDCDDDKPKPKKKKKRKKKKAKRTEL